MIQLDLVSTMPKPERCQIVDVGRRRDGGTRYWCIEHRADATAKYGRPARECRYAAVPPIKPEETLTLDVDKYRGGIALWGAVPAIYDTTRRVLDRGIHVHARVRQKGSKAMDETWRAVRLTKERANFLITDIEAIYFMVSSVFGFEMKDVKCTYCGYPHLDKDWFSVHPHRRHLCAGCGRNFRDTEISIGNPIWAARDALGLTPQQVVPSDKKLTIRQNDFPGGLQIWGSNPAIIWTTATPEMEGIHVHAFESEAASVPAIDETFSEVIVDDISLDPAMVRMFMAQSTLPHLQGRIAELSCIECGASKFDSGENAFTPEVVHKCRACGARAVAQARIRKLIANPIIGLLRKLADAAPRIPQKHDLGLLPETL